MSIIRIHVEKCDSQCPFYESIIGYVDCKHPYWLSNNIDAHETLLATSEFHDAHIKRNGGIPEKCPLKCDKIVQLIQLK